MKVLHVYKRYFPDSIGGVEQVINQIVRSTAKLGVHAEVLSTMPKRVTRTVEVDEHLSHRCHSNFEIAATPFSMSAFVRFAELAKQVDIIHYHFPWPFMDLLHFACRIKKPCLVSYHSDIIKQKNLLKLYQPLLKRFLSSVDSIVAESPNYFKTSRVLQSFSDKVRVIPIGLNKYDYTEPSDAVMSRWRERFPGKFFLFVGVLRYYKGLHILIEAAKRLDYPIVIVGSGPVEKALKAQVKRLEVKNIHFLGKLDDENKNALLQLCYTFVFPSSLRSEAFGVSLLESAMFGKPMISSEIGTGTTFINIDQVTGLVVPPNDPHALGQAMQFLWDNPQAAVAMGKRASQRYWDFFTAQAMGASYCKLYQELMR